VFLFRLTPEFAEHYHLGAFYRLPAVGKVLDWTAQHILKCKEIIQILFADFNDNV